MLKRLLIFMIFILCFSIICGCSNTNLQTQSGEESAKFKVIRYPLLGETDNADYSDYYESGLIYPTQSNVFDHNLESSSKRFVLNNKEYTATYCSSKIYTDDKSVFLNQYNFDEYVVKGKVDYQVFRDTGNIRKIHVYSDELEKSEKLVTDFSEIGLKNAALSVLTNLYGSTILEHMDRYYQVDFAKLIEYANTELNRYVVCYRAYLNNVPTDDVIYVNFSLTGKLIGVSSQKYLQYIDVDNTLLTPISSLEADIRSAVSKLNYSSVNLRETDVPCYYTMNSSGELYYVMEWTAFKPYTEEYDVSCVEVFAAKAI